MPAPLTVFYNTKCPVCDAGIGWQKRKLIAAAKAGRVEFHDINREPEALSAYGASLDDIRRRLHALGPDGRLFVGADAVLAIWRATPGEGWLAALFGAPGVIVLTRYAYDRFADALWYWNKRAGRW
jgi:predicted DCC family thiol-disulfide oxidoreductase YuxK